MGDLDIKVVDSLTVNLNQEDYSTEGQVLNDIAVYVEDEQLLFDAALTQDSINLYTRETPDTIIFDAKEITDGISKLESLIEKTSKESTLLAKVAELKEALNTIDFTAIEQAIQGVENITAKEATLIQGVSDIIKAVKNIDFTDLENSIAEVKNAVVNIDLSALAKEDTLAQGIASISQKVDNIVIPEVDTTPLAKEDTLTQGVNTISQKIDDIHIPELDKSDLAKEATLSSGISTLSNKIDNIDLSSVENKVDEGVETLSSKIDNIDLSAVENKVQEESAAIQTKIDNIKLPEIDTTELAKQGENKEATNSAIYALLSQFGNSVLQEDVTIVCNCAEDIAWEEYGVAITYADGTSQSLPMSENGTCSFSVKIGQEYSVQLPVIGAYIAPTRKTYTASTSSRQIYWSYVVSGVFGLDELGRRYTIEQIEALEDNSIIKYIGYTDEYLENSPRDDGGIGNGVLIPLDSPIDRQYENYIKWSTGIGFSPELLPYTTTEEEALKLCDGDSYTNYVISEGIRLNITTDCATWCRSKKIKINGEEYIGFLPAYGQLARFLVNKTKIDSIFSICGKTVWIPYLQYIVTSNQYSESDVLAYSDAFSQKAKTARSYTIVFFNLPK